MIGIIAHRWPSRISLTRPGALSLSAGAAVVGLVVGGCGVFSSTPRGATSLFQVFQPPSYVEAAEWALDDFNPENRYRGLILLAEAPFAGEAVYVDLYRRRLEDPDSGIRQAAVRALGIHGSPEDAPAIAALLTDEQALTRAEAARALQKLHNPRVIPSLIERTRPREEADAEVRAAAADALGQYRDPVVLQALVAALADRSLTVNRRALDSLETLTGQNFELDSARWFAWIDAQTDPFAAGRLYTHEGFSRPRHPVEYLPFPFIDRPPNLPDAPPVGLPRP